LAPLLDILPNHPDLLALLGLADLGMHNPGSALRRFEEAIRIFPRHEYAILIARAEIAGGDVDSARALLEPLAKQGSTAEVRTQAQRLLRELPQATSGTSAAGSTPSQAVMPVFRETKPGEQRESGTLTEIACGRQWVILHVRARDREVRVASTRLEYVNFITYGGATPAPIACGVRASPEPILVTWRAEPTAPSGTDGIVEAIEFLPPVGK
jgi:FimV-like protein